MAETLDAEQYRQALRLILSELEDLDTAHPVDIGYRIGELKAHLRTLIGESGRPPMVGLGGSRTWPGSGRNGSGRPPHNRPARELTGMVNLDDTSRCPVGPECESCGRTDELAVSTADTPAGVLCMTVCDACELTAVHLVLSPAEETTRVREHGAHVG